MDTNKKKSASAATNKDVSAPQDEKRRPVDTIRIGDVSCSIWKREAQMQGALRRFYSCTFERSYKDRDGSYKYTKTFDRDSLGSLVAVIQKTEDRLGELEQEAEG